MMNTENMNDGNEEFRNFEIGRLGIPAKLVTIVIKYFQYQNRINFLLYTMRFDVFANLLK